jgi:hypothetical protein
MHDAAFDRPIVQLRLPPRSAVTVRPGFSPPIAVLIEVVQFLFETLLYFTFLDSPETNALPPPDPLPDQDNHSYAIAETVSTGAFG